MGLLPHAAEVCFAMQTKTKGSGRALPVTHQERYEAQCES
jgi:hypothetical protein